MYQVTGVVRVKETNAGFPEALVEAYDVDPGVRPDELFLAILSSDPEPEEATAPGGHGAGLLAVPRFARLATGLTAGPAGSPNAGSFEIKFEDADFQRRNPKLQRPNLVLVVRSGDDEDAQDGKNILHITEVRRNAETSSAYIIRISTKKLQASGLNPPTRLEPDIDDPQAIIQKVKQGVRRHLETRKQVQAIARELVESERSRTAEVEKQVERRLVDKLTGVPADRAEELNFTPPGANVETAMFSALSRSIDRRLNTKPPAKGYLVLTEEQAKQFMVGDKFREDIRPEEIAPFLFGGGADGSQRPAFLVRESPVDVLRPAVAPPELFPSRPAIDAQAGGNGAGPASDNGRLGSAAGDSGLLGDESHDPPPQAITDLVGRLIGTVVTPEEAALFGIKPRPTQDDIQTSIDTFNLRSGPADLPAFYDFHSLHFAWDYIWQKAIDEGVIEGAKTLSRQLLDLGGDPLGALQNGRDPILALRDELRVVQNAHASLAQGGALGGDQFGVLHMIKEDKLEETPDPTGPNGNTEPRPGGSGVGGGGGLTGGQHQGTTVPTSTTGQDPVLDQGKDPFPHELLNQIETLLNERFAFEIFTPGSINFGILVTYRQRWVPINYQVGRLVSTMTLTPKEERELRIKRVVKKERSVREMEQSLRIRKDEEKNTGRDEAEIVSKAESKTNFNLSAKGTFDIYIAEGESTTVFGKDAATSSSDIKKAFREAVIAAAMEYKNERKLEVETKESYEDEIVESIKIMNPSQEITVTYLFYELERRYNVSEQIHGLMPVVGVAMEVPSPSRRSIDSLLLKFGSIIGKFLLDDQFRRPLEYFRTKLVGDEYALGEMKKNLNVMESVVKELQKSYSQARTNSNLAADMLTNAIVRKAEALGEDKSEGLFEQIGEVFVGEIEGEGESGNETINIEEARIYEDLYREGLERAINREKSLRAQLDSETAALRDASDNYAKAVAEHLNCLMDLGTLRLHIKENLLYYMQAIWSHTFKDQLFLTVHKWKVPRLPVTSQAFRLSAPDEIPASAPTGAKRVVLQVDASVQFQSGLDPNKDYVDLVEVADLDTMLGFKGNYILFPMIVPNALTDYMMTPFVDAELGLHDPDELGNFTPAEFVAYARSLIETMQAHLENGEISQDEFDAAVKKLQEQLMRLLSAPRRAEDEITVPTGSLYVESLTGANPVIDDFQKGHRLMDVKKVQAEVRKLELENARFAARILGGELEDPDIERKVVISGNGQPIVVPPIDP